MGIVTKKLGDTKPSKMNTVHENDGNEAFHGTPPRTQYGRAMNGGETQRDRVPYPGRHMLLSCLIRILHMRYIRIKKPDMWMNSVDHIRNLCRYEKCHRGTNIHSTVNARWTK